MRVCAFFLPGANRLLKIFTTANKQHLETPRNAIYFHYYINKIAANGILSALWKWGALHRSNKWAVACLNLATLQHCRQVNSEEKLGRRMCVCASVFVALSFHKYYKMITIETKPIPIGIKWCLWILSCKREYRTIFFGVIKNAQVLC